ncbi:unnamed protein product [Cyprideis torosa]|uniref:Uncharacterized protein n=1 Tax=Cyprideis torosa TaxID=163714 RepID=A0A7R8ZUL2_9CRUS|nr:unnamed protein product [Cyprideis torosa]CAG0900937.1 unnamed protein product [Cyprideis torosa]
MAELKMDIEEPSLQPPRSQSETAVKEESAETEATGHQPYRRTKRKSLKTKKATIHHDCAVCGRRFKKRDHLKEHERVHSGDKPFNCTYCHKRFTSGSDLKVHARTHTKERPYECNVCGKSFSQAGHLQTHVRIHTGEKLFECPVCGKGFKSRYELRIHARTHTKERPYDHLSLCETFSSKEIPETL